MAESRTNSQVSGKSQKLQRRAPYHADCHRSVSAERWVLAGGLEGGEAGGEECTIRTYQAIYNANCSAERKKGFCIVNTKALRDCLALVKNQREL